MATCLGLVALVTHPEMAVKARSLKLEDNHRDNGRGLAEGIATYADQ